MRERGGRMLLKQTGRWSSWPPCDVASVELEEGIYSDLNNLLPVESPTKNDHPLVNIRWDSGAGHLNGDPLEHRRLAFRRITLMINPFRQGVIEHYNEWAFHLLVVIRLGDNLYRNDGLRIGIGSARERKTRIGQIEHEIRIEKISALKQKGVSIQRGTTEEDCLSVVEVDIERCS